jgi:hypothetical protein
MAKRLKSVTSATLLKQLQSLYHAYLIWQPGKATPVTVLFLNVNDVLVTHDKLLVSSPGVFNLPDPDTNNQFRFIWAVSPEVDVLGLTWVVQRADNAVRTVVDSTGATARGDLWSNTTGKVINAP